MKSDVRALAINGAYKIAIEQHKDLRGRFFECWRSGPYSERLHSCPFVQANLSYSPGLVVRGLHYQVRSPQAQLVTVVRGVVYDVMVDLRRGSDTFGRVVEVELDSETPMQVYMPPGVAHGFQVLSDEAILHYMCTRYYDPEVERGLRWNDPGLSIAWPLATPVVSERDAAFPCLGSIDAEDLPE